MNIVKPLLIALFIIFILLGVYFDFFNQDKPENWSIIRSIIGITLATLAIIYTIKFRKKSS